MSNLTATLELIDQLKGLDTFGELDIQVIHPIKNLPFKEKKQLGQDLADIVEKNASHGVLGHYTIGNMVSRPENAFVLVNGGNVVLNIAPFRVIVHENSKSALELQFLHDFLGKISDVFIMASGDEVISIIESLQADAIAKNIVYKFTADEVPSFSTNGVYPLDDAESGLEIEQILECAETLWGYESLASIKLPHFALISAEGEIMGGARANEIVQGVAVVGGVKTIPRFRRQGVGTKVCTALVQKLQSDGLQIYLETDVDNFPAQKIYEKLGFDRVGHTIYIDKGTSMIEEAIIGDRDY